jgi:hypothetical protein
MLIFPSLFPNIAIKAKVENKGQYEQYLEELKPLREEMGIQLQEELYPEGMVPGAQK